MDIAAPLRESPTRGRTILVGDWNPVVRDWADIIRLSYLAGALYAFAIGDVGDGVRMLVTFAVSLAPRLLNTPRPFDLFFTMTIGLQAWGNLAGLFNGGNSFDRIDHALTGLGIAPLFYLWFVKIGLLTHTTDRRPRRGHIGLVIIGFCIGLSIGALYEMYEYFAVTQLGAHIFINEGDTVLDMVMDGVGSLTGSFLLLVWVVWGWGTERRVDRPHGSPPVPEGST